MARATDPGIGEKTGHCNRCHPERSEGAVLDEAAVALQDRQTLVIFLRMSPSHEYFKRLRPRAAFFWSA